MSEKTNSWSNSAGFVTRPATWSNRPPHVWPGTAAIVDFEDRQPEALRGAVLPDSRRRNPPTGSGCGPRPWRTAHGPGAGSPQQSAQRCRISISWDVMLGWEQEEPMRHPPRPPGTSKNTCPLLRRSPASPAPPRLRRTLNKTGTVAGSRSMVLFIERGSMQELHMIQTNRSCDPKIHELAIRLA